MRRPAEAFVASLLSAAALGLAVATPSLTGGFVLAQPYYARPAFFPWAALGLIVVFGAWTAFQAWRGEERELSDEIEAAHTSVPIALGGAALFAVYVALVGMAGYAAATFMAVLAWARWSGIGGRTSLHLAVATTAILYILFVVGFKVWFAPSWIANAWPAWN